MSLQSHIEELTRRHRALEKEIEALKFRRGSEPVQVVELKRRKLHLKDEMARLGH